MHAVGLLLCSYVLEVCGCSAEQCKDVDESFVVCVHAVDRVNCAV